MEGVIVTRGTAGAWVRGKEGWTLEPEPVAAANGGRHRRGRRRLQQRGHLRTDAGLALAAYFGPGPGLCRRRGGVAGGDHDDRSFYEPILENWEHS